MKTQILTIAITALLATTPALAQPQEQPQAAALASEAEQAEPETRKSKTDRKRLLKAGGIGCLTGGIGALLTGRKDKALTACALGAAVGGIASYQAQLSEARELAAEAQAAGMSATVATKEVQADGEKVEALDQLAIAYDPASMSSRDPKTVAVLDKIGNLSSKSKSPLTITVEGRDQRSCQTAVAELAARGTTVVDSCGKGSARILISPVPDVE